LHPDQLAASLGGCNDKTAFGNRRGNGRDTHGTIGFRNAFDKHAVAEKLPQHPGAGRLAAPSAPSVLVAAWSSALPLVVKVNGRDEMRQIFIAVGVMCLMVGGASAADPKVDAAVKTFKQTENDPGKLKTFCEMTQAMNAAGEKEDAATDAKVDGYLKQLGPEFQTAWNAGENVDENSPDGKTLDDAINELQSKCSA